MKKSHSIHTPFPQSNFCMSSSCTVQRSVCLFYKTSKTNEKIRYFLHIQKPNLIKYTQAQPMNE